MKKKKLMIGEEFILVHVRSDKEDYLNAIQNQYLRLVGGQSHSQCREHICPLISSYKKKPRFDGENRYLFM